MNTSSNKANTDEHFSILMNEPAIMGRRDAAYDRAIALLSQNMFSKSEAERVSIYKEINYLIEITIENSEQILAARQDSKNLISILQYFYFLHESVSTAIMLVQQESMITDNKEGLSNFLGKQAQLQLRNIDEEFSKTEMIIFNSIQELIATAKKTIQKFRQYRKRYFTKSQYERYQKSFKEFTKLYTNVSLKHPQTEDKSNEV
jgi:hypothetical protein